MMHSESDWANNQSTVIDLLRFPLIIAVLFIHLDPQTVCILDADFPIISGKGFLNVLYIAGSHTVVHSCLNLFFLFSGYLFFRNMTTWSWDSYRAKISKRVKSLLIPYLVWNVIAIVFIALQKVALVYAKGFPQDSIWSFITHNTWHLFYDCTVLGDTEVNILGWPHPGSGPVNFPLWFLRDLMALSILTPLIYWLVKKLKIYVLIILLAAYCTRIWPEIPGLHIISVFNYTVGAYLAINQYNFVRLVRKIYRYILPFFVLFFVGCVIYNGHQTIMGDNLFPYLMLSTSILALAFTSVLVERHGLKANPTFVKSCIFVYAIHAVPIFIKWTPLTFVKQMLEAIIPGQSLLESMTAYVLSPIVTAVLCALFCKMQSRKMPRLTSFLTGNRL